MDDVTLTREQKKHVALLGSMSADAVVFLFGEWLDKCIVYLDNNQASKPEPKTELWWYEKFIDGFKPSDAVLMASSSFH